MRHQALPGPRTALSLLLTGGISLLGCNTPVDIIDPTYPSSGGSGGIATGGAGVPAAGGTGGSSGGSPGPSPGATGGAPGGTGGSLRADAGGSSRADVGGSSRADTGAPPSDAAPAAPAAPTFTRIFNQILAPGCAAPNNACHSVPRDQYFFFAEGQQNRSYMLLVNEPPRVGTIPGRLNTLLGYVTPQNGNPVRMPPQSGPDLGNPPVRKPPLTMEQIQLIRTWASSGALND